MKEVELGGYFAEKDLVELRSTLSSLSSEEAAAVLNDRYFVTSTPLGVIYNPAAFAQRIAKTTRCQMVRAKTFCCKRKKGNLFSRYIEGPGFFACHGRGSIQLAP